MPATLSPPNRIQLTLFDTNSLTTVCSLTGKKGRKGNTLRVKEEGKKGKKRQGKRSVTHSVTHSATHSVTPNLFIDKPYEIPVVSQKYCQTEQLLYWYWDAIKQRSSDRLFKAVTALGQYLTNEQLDVLLTECKWHLSLEDKCWLLYVLQGNKLQPLSLLLPCHHQRWGLINMVPSFPYRFIVTGKQIGRAHV